MLFKSGALNEDGSIVGNDDDADPTCYEPHYSENRSADQVQIYEAILTGMNGEVTTGLRTVLSTDSVSLTSNLKPYRKFFTLFASMTKGNAVLLTAAELLCDPKPPGFSATSRAAI